MKPPSLIVHDVPGEKHAGRTLVDWLRQNIAEINKNFPANDPRPGIVHRLDADTSGVILVAKHPASLKALQELFRSRQIEKTYQALVLGSVRGVGTWSGSIVRTGTDTAHQVKRLSFSWEKQQPKPAETAYRPVHHYQDQEGRAYTLLELKPKTGRTHQLRVQCADAGWPIVGDQTYSTKESREASASLGLARQFLHATKLSFHDPSTKEMVEVSAPLPHDLLSVMNALESS